MQKPDHLYFVPCSSANRAESAIAYAIVSRLDMIAEARSRESRLLSIEACEIFARDFGGATIRHSELEQYRVNTTLGIDDVLAYEVLL